MYTLNLIYFSSYYSYKPINDVEIISGTENRACSKSVNKLYGKSYLYDGEVLKEGDVLGSTGQFVNGAAIVCGGKNFLPNFSMESASLLQEIVILARKFIKSKVNSPLSFPRGKLKVKSKIL